MRRFQKGVIDPLSLFAILFLVTSLITATAVTNNPVKKQLLNSFAAIPNAIERRDAERQARADAAAAAAAKNAKTANQKAEKAGTPADTTPISGFTLDQIKNTGAAQNRTGYDCSKGGCPSDVEVSGFYKAPNGKYYPVAESAGGPTAKDLAYITQPPAGNPAEQTGAAAAATPTTFTTPNQAECKDAADQQGMNYSYSGGKCTLSPKPAAPAGQTTSGGQTSTTPAQAPAAVVTPVAPTKPSPASLSSADACTSEGYAWNSIKRSCSATAPAPPPATTKVEKFVSGNVTSYAEYNIDAAGKQTSFKGYLPTYSTTFTGIEKTDKGITTTETTIVRRKDTGEIVDTVKRTIIPTPAQTTPVAPAKYVVFDSGKQEYVEKTTNANPILSTTTALKTTSSTTVGRENTTTIVKRTDTNQIIDVISTPNNPALIPVDIEEIRRNARPTTFLQNITATLQRWNSILNPPKATPTPPVPDMEQFRVDNSPANSKVEIFDLGLGKLYQERIPDKSSAGYHYETVPTESTKSTSVEKTESGNVTTETTIVRRTDTGAIVDTITRTIPPQAALPPTVTKSIVKDPVTGQYTEKTKYLVGGAVISTPLQTTSATTVGRENTTTIIKRNDTNQIIDVIRTPNTPVSPEVTPPKVEKSKFDPPAFKWNDLSTWNPRAMPDGKYYNTVRCVNDGSVCGSGYCNPAGVCADKPITTSAPETGAAAANPPPSPSCIPGTKSVGTTTTNYKVCDKNGAATTVSCPSGTSFSTSAATCLDDPNIKIPKFQACSLANPGKCEAGTNCNKDTLTCLGTVPEGPPAAAAPAQNFAPAVQTDPSIASTIIPNSPGLTWLAKGCGPATIANILNEFSKSDKTLLEVANLIPSSWWSSVGISSSTVAQYLHSQGYNIDPFTGSDQFGLAGKYMTKDQALLIGANFNLGPNVTTDRNKIIPHVAYFDSFTIVNGKPVYNLVNSYDAWGKNFKCTANGDNAFVCTNPDGKQLSINTDGADLYIFNK